MTPGQQLGPYEILSLLGKGGMGEVYRARDVKLKREVALKILPSEFSRDADRVVRFQREAEVLASLNHPNIAAIYNVEEAAGSRFLVLELVEGETLAERIRRGPLPVHEALGIGKSICDALEAAHEKGITHRDLKPANVKITPEGIVKVLDFGLAKAVEQTAASASMTNSPTMTALPTGAGMILGTASYMSPEQAKGRSVDRRTDVFAFGCVLYEMLTGRRAFDGEDVADIISRVLQRDPEWSQVPAEIPPSIQRLMRVCLEKDLRRRRQTVTDVRIDIEDALTAPIAETMKPARSSRRGARMAAWIASLAAAALIIALAIPAARHLLETPPPEMRLQVNTPLTLTPFAFALSPDGRHIVFVASGEGQQRLWLRPLDKADAQPLAGTEGADNPFWSPDSRSVGFFAASKLFRLDIAGGLPQPLAPVGLGLGGAWNADGTILFVPAAAGPIMRVPASGGDPVPATQLEAGQNNHRLPHFLTDGRHFLFFARGMPEASGIYLGSLDSKEIKRLTAAESAGALLKANWMLFVRQGTLIARRLDLERGELTGDPITVADPVGYDPASLKGGFSVSNNGAVAYRAGGAGRVQLTWLDRTGKTLGLAGPPDANGLLYPDLSPDERRVVVNRTIQNNSDTYLLDVIRGGFSRFTFDVANDNYGIWSHDGTYIVFPSNRKASFDLYMGPSNQAGVEDVLLQDSNFKFPQDWSRDGRYLLYYEVNQKTGRDLWALEMTGNERKKRVVVNRPYEELMGQFSPDGRWVAYQTNESGRFEIVVQGFPEPMGKSQVSF